MLFCVQREGIRTREGTMMITAEMKGGPKLDQGGEKAKWGIQVNNEGEGIKPPGNHAVST